MKSDILSTMRSTRNIDISLVFMSKCQEGKNERSPFKITSKYAVYARSKRAELKIDKIIVCTFVFNLLTTTPIFLNKKKFY